jgi:hypothetical protein
MGRIILVSIGLEDGILFRSNCFVGAAAIVLFYTMQLINIHSFYCRFPAGT